MAKPKLPTYFGSKKDVQTPNPLKASKAVNPKLPQYQPLGKLLKIKNR